MKFVYFVHAIASCWNNGNAHFLRGVGRSLQILGHEVIFCEPARPWSETNLIADHGALALAGFREAFPTLNVTKYDPDKPDLDRLTHGADVVIVHEWNPRELVNALGRLRRDSARFTLLFHDTHHRAVSDAANMERLELDAYDGVLAFGEVLAEVYRKTGWGSRVWAWHEGADTDLFAPHEHSKTGDLVWIGNWGDEERSDELREFLLAPVRELRLTTHIYGVRYPEAAVQELAQAGIGYRGWLANHRAAEIFAQHRATVHIPRRPYRRLLPGIPTIRVFEALACGIPLICAPWDDVELLFPAGSYLTAANGAEMRRQLRTLLADDGLASELRRNGLRVIQERHSCRHRARELIDVIATIRENRMTEAA
jgi:spore maturation protein CgeB